MFHCHNLVHEDHDMMAAFNVTKIDLTDFGYPERVDFSDPLSILFSAKPYSGTNINEIQDVLLPYFQSLDAYPDANAVIDALNDYHKNGPKSKSTTVISSATFVSTTAPAFRSPPCTLT